MPGMAGERQFDPRLAALAAAGSTLADAAASGDPDSRMVAQAANAVVCGLVYVGDQVRGLAEQREPPVVSAEGESTVRVVSPVVTLEVDGVPHVLHAGDEVRTGWGGAGNGGTGE